MVRWQADNEDRPQRLTRANGAPDTLPLWSTQLDSRQWQGAAFNCKPAN
jgi:hypothetical protein